MRSGAEAAEPEVQERPRRTGWFGTLLVVLGYLSLLPSLAWWAAFRNYGDSHWAMFVANSVAPYLFLPMPIVLLAGLWRRRWGLFTAGLVPLAVFLVMFGPALVPRSLKVEPVPASTPTLRLITFNVHTDNPDPAGVARSVLDSDADVVALQEVAPEMGAALVDLLADEYPYHDMVARERWDGLAVFSRVPVSPLETRIESLGTRNPQLTTLDLPQGQVTLINVHNLSIPRTLPDWPDEITYAIRQRERIADGIYQFALSRDRPTLVVGDFNTTPRSTAYETITAALNDTWLEGGFGFGQTFPGGPLKPTPLGFDIPSWLLRIDYVFHSDEWTTLNAQIGPWDGNSDHRPVLVELALSGLPVAAQR